MERFSPKNDVVFKVAFLLSIITIISFSLYWPSPLTS